MKTNWTLYLISVALAVVGGITATSATSLAPVGVVLMYFSGYTGARSMVKIEQ